MAQSLPPLNWFRAFESAARHLSFTAAAGELALTQSAISQQVRLLESKMGTALFIRHARGLQLTDAGRRLLPQVGNALATLASATQTLQAGDGRQLLTVAASVSVAQWVIAPALNSFVVEHPNVSVRIVSSLWPDDFRTSLADVEIRFGSEQAVGQGANRFANDHLIAVASKKLKKPLEKQTLIEAVGLSSGWKEWADVARYEQMLVPSVLVDSHGLALDLAANGQGVALTSALLAQRLIRSRKLVQLHDVELPVAEGYFLAAESNSVVAGAFVDWLASRGMIT